MFLICNKKPTPFQCAKRIVVFFAGLCIGYYGYTSAIDIYHTIVQNKSAYAFNVFYDLKDLLVWVIVSIFAGVWGFIMIKKQDKKSLFCIMVVPFIMVNLYCIYFNLTCEPMNIFMSIVDVLAIIGIVLCVTKKFEMIDGVLFSINEEDDYYS